MRAIDPDGGSDVVQDLAIHDGRFVDVDALPPGFERVDGSGLIAAPGFVDLHTHLREPGGEEAETIESGARAAAHGGFTTICAMPNTDPALDAARHIAWVTRRASEAACRVRVVGALTTGRGGTELADLEAMAAADVIGFSDDGSGVASAELTRKAMTRLAALGLPLIEHAEDPALAGDGVMRTGRVAVRLGLEGWPPQAELAMVERDIALAARTGARLHLTHISSAASVDAVRNAQSEGVAVTADVTPHHLALTDAWVAGDRRFAWEAPGPPTVTPDRAYDGSCRVNPPLGSRSDALALLEGLRDGTIDAIATDHAPHPAHRKLVPFGEAAPGMIGLETALPVGLAAVEAGALDLMTLLRVLTAGPAAVISETRGLKPGAAADLVVFDTRARWRVQPAGLASRSSNTPLLGMQLPGVVRLTVAEGRVTYRS